MQRRIGDVIIDSIAAESPKFTAPLLLIHGLWCTASVWRPFMRYLAHRGWTCHALTLRGHGGGVAASATTRFGDYQQDVRVAIDACEAPPVVLGHDLGGLLALGCGASVTRAIVALAPLAPRMIAGTAPLALSGWRIRFAARRARPLTPPRGAVGRAYFGSGAPGYTTVDSSIVASELAAESFALANASAVPTLVMAGGADAVCHPQAVQALAVHFRATYQTVAEAGHAMPWDPGWEQRASEIHHWVVRSLGDPLLAFRDEEDA